MALIDFPGFPDEIGDEIIQFPDPIEILREPMWGFAPAEHVYKHGSRFQKMLLDKAPLTHKTEYIEFSTQIRVAYPGILLNKIECPHLQTERNEWHVDGLDNSERYRVHSISNTLGTEFNTNPFQLDVPDQDTYFKWICEQSTLHGHEWGLNPQAAPNNRFVTFNRHVHRAPKPTKRELRYFIRITESDKSLNKNNGRMRSSFSEVFLGTEAIKNVMQSPDKIEIHFAPGMG